jgi:hypothetical protein
MKTRIKSLDFDFGKFKILIFGKEKFIWGDLNVQCVQ